MTFTEASLRSALDTALAAQGLRMDDGWGGAPPYVLMFNAGSDFSPILHEQTRMAFRLTLVHSRATDQLSTKDMASYEKAMVKAVRGLPGVRLDGLSPDLSRDVGGVQHWSADLTISAMIDIS
jgi:hypothetical protein